MAPVHVAALLAHPAVRDAITRALAARGVHGDTRLIHVDPREEAMLRMMGGVGTINPRTGLRQFYPGDNSNAGEGVGGAGDFGGGVSQGAGFSGSDFSGGGALPGGAPADKGYGRASTGASSIGSGAGAGGGHSGNNYISQTYGGQAGPPGGGYRPVALPQAPAINNVPPAPVSLTPMMSDTATTDLTGGRFGALPSYATTPYQIGMAPSAYPTPGVNAGIGAPGYAGNPLPGQDGGGGAPGGGGGVSGGGPLVGGINVGDGGILGGGVLGPGGTIRSASGAMVPTSSPAGQQAILQAAAAQSGEGYQGTWADAFNQASHNIMAQQAGLQAGPTQTLGVLLQMLGVGQGSGQQGGSPRNTGAVTQAALPQATLQGPVMGGLGQAPQPIVQAPLVQQAAPLQQVPATPARAPLVAAQAAPLTVQQRLLAAQAAARTIGANRW
jgi:hypothetical protein